MANRIKGLTVEIGGDTTKLQDALRGVNNEIRNTGNSLRDINKLLKLDPGNTDLITQKQRNLAEAISATKEKLLTLKEAQRQADEALKNGTITQDQYDALQREIADTTQELNKLEQQAVKTASVIGTKMQAVGAKMQEVGRGISSAGQSLTRNVTVPIAAVGTAAVKVAADFDAAMSKVAAVSGATGSDFDALRDKAREMGAKTKFSASEAAEAMNYMAMAGWKTGDMLSGIEGIMNLAAASGEELGTTSDIVTDALTAFGLTAADSGHFADVLAAASSNANTNVSMMGETFKYAAPIAGALGYSIEDTAEAIGLMANAGIKSSMAGTSLRKIMTELSGDIEICGRNLGDVVIKTTNADGSMRSFHDILSDCRAAFSKLTESEKASAAEALVGKTAMSGFLALMNAGEGDIVKLENAIDTCDGAAEKMASVMQDNLSGQLTILMSQLQELAISMADILMPTIRELVTSLQGLVDWLNSLDDGTRNMIVKAALIVAALGPVLVVIGNTITVIGTITSGLGNLINVLSYTATTVTEAGGAFSALTSAATGMEALAAIGTIISGIVAVVGGAVLAIKNFVDMFINGFNAVKEVLMVVGIAIAAVGAVILGAPALVAAAVAGAIAALATLVILIKEHWGEIKEVLGNAVEALGVFFTETIPAFFSNLVQKIRDTWVNITSSISGAFDAIKNAVVSKLQPATDLIQSIWSTLVSHFGPLLESFRYLFETIFMAIGILVERAMSAISGKISEIWQSIVSFMQPKLQAAHDFISSVLSAVQGVVSDILSAISSRVNAVLTEIHGFISERLNAAKATASGIFRGMADEINMVVGWIGDYIRNGFENAANFIRNLASEAWHWGSDLIHGIADGIWDALDAVGDAVEGVADKIRSVLHFSVPDEGPLTDYESWMPDFMKGLSEGIRKSRHLVKDAIGDVADDMVINPTVGFSRASELNQVGSHVSNNTNNQYTINVYGAEGQDVNALADIVMDRITNTTVRKGAVFA